MNILKWALIGFGALLCGSIILAIALYRLARVQPQTEDISLGVFDGRLTPCPDSPNCVSTQADPSDDIHHVEPIPFEGERSELVSRLVSWIGEQERAMVVQQEAGYIRGAFTSQVFGFHDDVELYFSPDKPVLHFRSASRVGYSDLGVNRKRYEKVRRFVSGSVD